MLRRCSANPHRQRIINLISVGALRFALRSPTEMILAASRALPARRRESAATGDLLLTSQASPAKVSGASVFAILSMAAWMAILGWNFQPDTQNSNTPQIAKWRSTTRRYNSAAARALSHSVHARPQSKSRGNACGSGESCHVGNIRLNRRQSRINRHRPCALTGLCNKPRCKLAAIADASKGRNQQAPGLASPMPTKFTCGGITSLKQRLSNSDRRTSASQ